MKRFAYWLAAGCLTGLVPLQAGAQVAHSPRGGENQVGNPGFAGTAGWDLQDNTFFDPDTSRTADGSGSILLTVPHGEPGSSGLEMALSNLIPVEPGKTYTLSAYIKTAGWPNFLSPYLGRYGQLSPLTAIENTGESRYGTSRDGVWEEIAVTYTAEPGDGFAQPKFIKRANTQGFGKVWLDDIYFGEGIGLERPPAAKTPFAGGRVRVDGDGNFEVRRGEVWEPFFPLCVYSDNQRDKSVYSAQGFNCDIRLSSIEQFEAAAAAVSDFNPDGLLGGFDFSPYLDSSTDRFRDFDTLTDRLSAVLASDAADNLLLFHWDNENDFDQWQLMGDVIDRLKALDAVSDGARQRPIYALNGNFGLARSQAAAEIVEVTGTYFWSSGAEDSGRANGNIGTDAFELLQKIEGQTIPVTFAQLNEVNGAGAMRRRLFQSIIGGAKGMAYWRDCFNSRCRAEFEPDFARPIDEQAWWPDIPRLRTEVDAMLPLIRQSVATDWTVVSSDPDIVHRVVDYEGEGYMILLNLSSEERVTTFDVARSPYRALGVADYFSGAQIVDIADGRFAVAVPGVGVGSGTAVLRLLRGS